MATLLEDLLTVLVDGGAGTLPTNDTDGDLFAGAMPDQSADEAMVLATYAGEGPIHTMGPDGDPPQLVQPRVQLLARGREYLEADSRIKVAHALLQSISNRTLGGTVYKRVEAVQSEPFFLGMDKSQRFLIVCNYAVIKEPEA